MEDNSKYVRDEVFRSEIRRIEQRVDSAIERIELKMDAYTARMDGKFDKLEAKVDGQIGKLESRIDGIRDFIGWTIGLGAIIITVGTILIQVVMK